MHWIVRGVAYSVGVTIFLYLNKPFFRIIVTKYNIFVELSKNSSIYKIGVALYGRGPVWAWPCMGVYRHIIGGGGEFLIGLH